MNSVRTRVKTILSHALLAALAGCCGVAPALGQPPEHGQAVVYVGQLVPERGSGPAPESGLATLQAALDLAEQKFDEGYREVAIRVRPGRYARQRAETAGAGNGRHLVITAAGENGSAVFDGEDAVDTWLTIRARTGEPANLGVTGLAVTRYGTAITINGSREALDRLAQRIDITANTFDAIGQAAAGKGQPSTAVVRLVNTHNSRIAGNRFIHFRNAEKCTLLHALYVAHNSTANLIEDNQFEDGCGDAIRFRDASGDNIVRGNRFVDAWAQAPISDWYCDSSARSDCTKRTPECPSLGNRLIGNTMSAQHVPDKGMSAEFGDVETPLCPAGALAKRFITE